MSDTGFDSRSVLRTTVHTTQEATMTGIITQIQNHGTIVVLRVEDRDGGVELVHFDHRPFRHMAEAEDHDLIGREVRIHGTQFDHTVEFDPDPEWADAERDQLSP